MSSPQLAPHKLDDIGYTSLSPFSSSPLRRRLQPELVEADGGVTEPCRCRPFPHLGNVSPNLKESFLFSIFDGVF